MVAAQKMKSARTLVRETGAYLDMLLQILRTLERLAAKVTFVGLQGDMNSDVRGDVITLNGRDATLRPLTL